MYRAHIVSSWDIARDCGWQSDTRTLLGEITWNQTRIPSGMGALGDYIHGLGLRFGVYSSAYVNCDCVRTILMMWSTTSGTYSCSMNDGLEHWLGSGGHEQSDAYTFTAWGVDYLKVRFPSVYSHTCSPARSVRKLLCGESHHFYRLQSLHRRKGDVGLLVTCSCSHARSNA
jgi:hypothetical protein